MKIYTKTGDTGTTSLFTGERVPKNDPFIEALGTVDECNCAIGAALSHIPDTPPFTEPYKQLIFIQHALFDLGAALATPLSSGKKTHIEKTRFDCDNVNLLENWIDRYEKTLPPLKTFILPGGHTAGAMLHLARSVCRRAERLILEIYEKGGVPGDILIFLNRLSDYLFVISRSVNHLLENPEVEWQKHLQYA